MPNMKRPYEEQFGMQTGGSGMKQMASSVGMAIKMLMAAKEAAALIGPGGSVSKQIAEMTGSKIHLSGRGEFYPGTQMQEVCVKGSSADIVCAAVMQILAKLSEETGRIMGGEYDVEEGGCRVHFVLPTFAARSVIGKGGENIKLLRGGSGMKVHVEEVVIGQGDLAEQVVSLAGPLMGMQTALPNLLEKIMEVAMMPWFTKWAFSINAAQGPGGEKGGFKGKGKGKGKPDFSQGGGMPGGYQGGMPGGMPGGFSGGAGAPGQGGVNVDMLSSAVSAVSDSLASPLHQSSTMQCACPAGCVGAVMGKGGEGFKEISMATGTQINITDVAGNAGEKAIVISGNCVGVVSAYLHVIGRIATAQEMLSAGLSGMDEQTSGADYMAMMNGAGTQL